MNKRVFLSALILILSLGLWGLFRQSNWPKDKNEFKKLQEENLSWQEKYNNLLQQWEESKAENDLLSQEITLLQKEKTDLLDEAETLRRPEYLADIVADHVRLKIEVKALEEKIKIREETISSLFEEKEDLQALLGQEKHLSMRLTQSIAEDKKKDYGLNRELTQKSSLLSTMEANINKLQKTQEALKERVNGLERIVQEKDKEIRELEKRLNEAYSQNKGLENKLNQTRQEKELLEEELSATKKLYEEAKATKEALETNLNALVKEKNELAVNLLSASEKVVSLDEKLGQMEEALTEQELNKKILEERQENLAQENKALQEKISQLEKEASLKLELTKTVSLPPAEAKEAVPLAKGKILASSDKYNFVIINIGENDGLKIGHRFSVYRREQRIGEIEVTRVRSNSAFANIVSLVEGLTISTEDTVR